MQQFNAHTSDKKEERDKHFEFTTFRNMCKHFEKFSKINKLNLTNYYSGVSERVRTHLFENQVPFSPKVLFSRSYAAKLTYSKLLS